MLIYLWFTTEKRNQSSEEKNDEITVKTGGFAPCEKRWEMPEEGEEKRKVQDLTSEVLLYSL